MSFRSTLALALIAFAPAARAATLTLAGTLVGSAGDDNDQIDRWRSTSVVKTLDLDSDNVYGTAGYVLFGIDDLGNGNPGIAATGAGFEPFTFVNGTRRTVSSIPSYLAFTTITPGSTGVATSYGYRLIDDPTAVPGPTVANIESGAALRNSAIGTEASVFDITIGSNFPAGGIRLGLLFGNTDAYDGKFRLEQTVGGTTSITVNQTATNALEMAFFDITNAVPGDAFRIYGLKNNPPNGNVNTNFLLGGITVDAIPEPASAVALVSGAALLFGIGRRRRQGE